MSSTPFNIMKIETYWTNLIFYYCKIKLRIYYNYKRILQTLFIHSFTIQYYFNVLDARVTLPFLLGSMRRI